MFNEYALRISQSKIETPDYFIFNPKGGVEITVSIYQKRAKWLEIICDMAKPSDRDEIGARLIARGHLTPRAWQAIVDNWTQELWDRWLIQSKLGWGEVRFAEIDSMWNDIIINNSGFVDSLNNDPTGTVKIIDSWLWSEIERKNYFLVVNNDDIETTSKSRDNFKYSSRGDVHYYHNKYLVSYWNRLGLSSEIITQIENRDLVVNPRFDILVNDQLISETVINFDE